MKHRGDNENTRSLRREGVFPWLLVGNVINFPNRHLLPSAEDTKTYSAQVEPRKMASDGEVLPPDPFNRAWDFCSLHSTSA